MNQEYRIAIFASGSGTNAEEITNYFKGHPFINVTLILSNNPKAGVLERARKLDIPAKVFTREEFTTSKVIAWLREYKVTHIVLAGFLWLIPSSLVNAYRNKIINIHPALLPKFGGKGMYGMKIHELVRQLNETETGITIHLVNNEYDEGAILYQAKCTVTNTDSLEQIADKVHQLEYAHYPKVIEKWILSDWSSLKFDSSLQGNN
jgi:phosphoribosylglycinamide formyltransferase-1